MSTPLRDALEFWFESVWRPRIRIRFLQQLWFVLWLVAVAVIPYNFVVGGPEAVSAGLVGIAVVSGLIINGFCVLLELFARWRGVESDPYDLN
ncbi:hypothetical protein [Halomarina rubra]|uniref:Uncharacterized protein n=1 Tax=Halomarina rubra TaxID=2071873 RepID=A0ABD6B0Q6_9EURY|nr:hypothetical protein [Halomarina rubra]